MSDRESEALTLFLGKGVHPYPNRDPERLVAEYGDRDGVELVAYVQAVLDELYKVTPDWAVEDLEGAAQRAIRTVRQQHSELSDDAIDALKWSYKWDWK